MTRVIVSANDWEADAFGVCVKCPKCGSEIILKSAFPLYGGETDTVLCKWCCEEFEVYTKTPNKEMKKVEVKRSAWEVYDYTTEVKCPACGCTYPVYAKEPFNKFAHSMCPKCENEVVIYTGE